MLECSQRSLWHSLAVYMAMAKVLIVVTIESRCRGLKGRFPLGNEIDMMSERDHDAASLLEVAVSCVGGQPHITLKSR